MRRIAPAIFVFMMTLLFSSCGIISADASAGSQSPIAIETYSTQPSDAYSRSDTESYYYVTSPTDVTTLPSVTTVPTSSELATVVCDQVTQGDEYTITDYETVMYANASVNVRALPDAGSDRMTHLDEGEKVLITGIVSNGWYRISLDGKECFVNGRYLKNTIITRGIEEGYKGHSMVHKFPFTALMILCMAILFGGLFVPIYVMGRKYQ